MKRWRLRHRGVFPVGTPLQRDHGWIWWKRQVGPTPGLQASGGGRGRWPLVGQGGWPSSQVTGEAQEQQDVQCEQVCGYQQRQSLPGAEEGAQQAPPPRVAPNLGEGERRERCR